MHKKSNKITVKTKKFPSSDIIMPSLGFGCAHFPRKEDNTTDIEKLQELVDYAIEHGVNYFDTACHYNDNTSEADLAKVLQKYERSDYLLSDKFPIWESHKENPNYEIFQKQLDKFSTDYFDFYQIHSLSDYLYERLHDCGLYEYLKKEKENGRIRKLGFSFIGTPELFERALNEYEWDFVTLQINYIEWKFVNAKKIYETALKYNKPVVVIDSLRRGNLANLNKKEILLLKLLNINNTPAAFSHRFAAELPNVMTVLCGMRNLRHLKENVKNFADLKPLSLIEKNCVSKFIPSSALSRRTRCTGCLKCKDICHVNIPAVMFLFNHGFNNKEFFYFFDTYGTLSKNERADMCDSCGKCIKVCPKKINIPQAMKNADKIIKKIFNGYF